MPDYTTIYRIERGVYHGWVRELPGVVAQGRDLRELTANLGEAILAYLETPTLSDPESFLAMA